MNRQQVRVLAVAVTAVVLGVLGVLTVSSGDETVEPLAAGPADTAYVGVVGDLQSVLSRYAALQGVASHDEVHLLGGELAGLDRELAELELRSRALGTDDASSVADLAAVVRSRAAAVHAQAVADHSGPGGAAVLQAFGRECALRAVRIGDALESTGGEAAPALAEAVAAVWPAPPDEGLGDVATRQ